MSRTSLAEPTSERVYTFFFQINAQNPQRVDDIDLQTYVKLKHSNSFAREFLSHLISRKEILNEDDSIEVLYKSLDGVDFERLSNTSTKDVQKNNVQVELESGPGHNTTGGTELSEFDIPSTSSASTEIPTKQKASKKVDKTEMKKVLSRRPDFKRKKPNRSGVWTFFVKTPTGGTCKICNAEVKSSGTTTNLTMHVKRRHQNSKAETTSLLDSMLCSSPKSQHEGDLESDPDDPIDPDTSSNKGDKIDLKDDNDNMNSSLKPQSHDKVLSTMSQPRIDTVVSTISSFKDGGAKSQAITNSLIYMLVKDDMPLNTTEKEGFKYFVSVIAPLYKAPKRTAVTNLLDCKYEVLCAIVKEKLAGITHFTITADIWTDTMNSISYLGCTVHFLDEGKLSTLVLGVSELSERHTAEYIQTIFQSTCENWNIPTKKVTAVVTDNGANIVKAAKDTFGSDRHLPCFAHSLNLVLTKVASAEPLQELITKVKAIVVYFGHQIAADELRKTQLKSPPLCLIQNVSTRWNSTFYMLERFLDLINPVSSVLLKLRNSPPMLTASEVAIIREILEILRPAEIVTKEMSGQKYVTSSKIIPIVHCLKKSIETVQTSSEIGDSIKTNLISELDRRYSPTELNSLTAIPAILDPRFKRLHFSDAMSCSRAIDKINVMLKQDESRATVVVDEESNELEAKSAHAIWKFHTELLKQCKTYETETFGSGRLHVDLKQYLSRNTIPLEADPIEYWVQQKENCPQLASIALKYLSIVATSVPCERLFSMAGNVVSPSRNRLSSARIGRILFMKSLDFSEWRM